jgi:hypothetical protein
MLGRATKLTRLRHQEEENRQLKQMFSDLSLQNQAVGKILQRSSQPCGAAPGSGA